MSIPKGLPALRYICDAVTDFQGLHEIRIEQEAASLLKYSSAALSNSLLGWKTLSHLCIVGIHIDEPAARALAAGMCEIVQVVELGFV